MKTVKTFNYHEIFAYDRSGERLAGSVQDLLNSEDHVIHTFYTRSTASTRGEGQSAIFFDTDILNLPDQVGYFGRAGGPDLPMDFILVPIEYNGQQYDAWITIPKLNICFNSAQRERLKEVLPKYFSDQPEKKLGFFRESNIITEEIDRNFTSDEQIAKIMDDPDITLEGKCRILFDRTPEHLFTFGLGSFYVRAELYEIANQNGVYEEFSDSISRLKGQCSNWKHIHTNRVGCSTVMCVSDQTERLTVQESYDYYVNHTNTTRFPGEGRSYPPIQWGAYLKYCVELFEEAVGYSEKKLGFFRESLEDKHLTEAEVERIVQNGTSDDEICKQLFNGRDYEYVVKACLDGCAYYNREVPECISLGIYTPFIRNNFDERTLTMKESFMYYVKGEQVDGGRRDIYPGTTAATGGQDMVHIIDGHEEHEPDNFNFQERRSIGFFRENLTTQKFNSIDNDLIKRVILKQVHDHGYIGGGYGYHNNNGTSYRNSPTAAEITRILDSEDNLENWVVPQVLLGRMNMGVSTLHPEGQYADYQNKCIEIGNKTHMAKDDITMVASFCNSYLRDLQYQERQRQRQEREQQHQAAVASDTNTGAGEEGTTVSFVVDTAKIAYWITPRYYNAESYPCGTIKATDGRTYIGNDIKDEVQVEHGMKFTGKIKKLTEFRGIKQTQVGRVEIQDASDTTIGFFRD